MADLPIKIPASVQIVDPKTGQPSQAFVDCINAVVSVLRDYEDRIDTLEP